MDGQGGILRLCRLCLVKDQVNIPIFEQQGDTRQIFLKISSCLAVKISREDKLPKNICEGCSDKLDSIFEFWNSSANAEKTLLSWLEQEEEKTGLIDQIPIEGLVKEETETLKNVNNETDPLPRKRARHTAAVKAQINITQELEDLITTQSLTKMEDESEVTDGEDKDPSYTEIPDNSDEDHQAGPSGVGKDGVESSVLLLINHEVSRRLPEDGSTICAFCGVFVAYRELKRHERSHRRPCSGVCSKCGLATKNIYQHMVTHREERRFSCQKCGLSFKHNKTLKVHLLVHESVGKFRCDTCGKRFKTAYNLKVHRRSHEVVKPYGCQYCLKTFTTKQSRDHHEKTHIKRSS